MEDGRNYLFGPGKQRKIFALERKAAKEFKQKNFHLLTFQIFHYNFKEFVIRWTLIGWRCPLHRVQWVLRAPWEPSGKEQINLCTICTSSFVRYRT
jgi:hypothetical protein